MDQLKSLLSQVESQVAFELGLSLNRVLTKSSMLFADHWSTQLAFDN